MATNRRLRKYAGSGESEKVHAYVLHPSMHLLPPNPACVFYFLHPRSILFTQKINCQNKHSNKRSSNNTIIKLVKEPIYSNIIYTKSTVKINTLINVPVTSNIIIKLVKEPIHSNIIYTKSTVKIITLINVPITSSP